MKKVMFALFVAASAVVANAAQVKWQLKSTSVSDANGAGLGSSPTVYMVLASALDSSYESATALAADSVSSSGFTIGKKSATATGTYASSTIAIGDTVSYYLVMADPDNDRYAVFGSYTSSAATADGANDYVDGVLQPAVTPTTDQYSASLSSATWTSFGGSSVPEPTSGLLLLVGAGMLALRRKQK